MVIRAAIERMKKLTLEERDNYLNNCYHKANERFNTTKASFSPDVVILVEECNKQREVHNIHWTKCYVDTAKQVPEVIFLNAGEEGKASTYAKVSDYSVSIRDVYVDWQLDAVKCYMFAGVGDE